MRCGALVLSVAAACGGGTKKSSTAPQAGGGTGDSQSMKDTGDPTLASAGGAGGASGGSGALPPGNNSPTPPTDTGPPVTFPNLDPDPAQAKAQVDQHLNVAKQALSAPTPDAETALRESKEALKIDAANVDAAAYVAFAYYHKKQYDTAELVLDDVFKRESAKKNANVYYVYGLVYDHTNRPDQAVLAYQKAIGINPNFASVLINVGVHQLENKQYDQATQTFERLTKEFGRSDAVTWTSLGSAYRGRGGDYPPGSNEKNQLVIQAEASYKRALQANANYGPAYYNLGLLYLDADPFPSGGGALDTLQRLNAAKSFLDQYKNMPGVDMKLYDERMKDITKAVKREEKKRKKDKKAGGGGGGGTP